MGKEIIIIAAVAQRVIGLDNTLPWRLPKDMKYFADTTMGHTVIMGRKTWDSIPPKYRPLPGRRNIVLSKSVQEIAGCEVFPDLDAALKATGDEKVFIAGGGEIYALALPFATHLYLTEVKLIVNGDTFFPEFDESEFKEVSRIENMADEKNSLAFDFVTYVKK